jgi:hypothetical protein
LLFHAITRNGNGDHSESLHVQNFIGDKICHQIIYLIHCDVKMTRFDNGIWLGIRRIAAFSLTSPTPQKYLLESHRNFWGCRGAKWGRFFVAVRHSAV